MNIQSDEEILQFKDKYFRIVNVKNKKLNIDRHILWLKPSDTLKSIKKGDRIKNSLYPLKNDTYIYNYYISKPHKMVFKPKIQGKLKGVIYEEIINSILDRIDMNHIHIEREYKKSNRIGYDGSSISVKKKEVTDTLSNLHTKSVTHLTVKDTLLHNELINQYAFLKLFDLTDWTITDYLTDWNTTPKPFTPKVITKSKHKYDLYRRLFRFGLPLDVDHTESGGGSTRIFHIKNPHNLRESKLACKFFALLFGLKYGDYVYHYRGGVKHYVKFDNSGLDFTCLGLFLSLLVLNIEHGLRGLDLIKGLGNSKLVRGKETVYESKDYNV